MRALLIGILLVGVTFALPLPGTEDLQAYKTVGEDELDKPVGVSKSDDDEGNVGVGFGISFSEPQEDGGVGDGDDLEILHRVKKQYGKILRPSQDIAYANYYEPEDLVVTRPVKKNKKKKKGSSESNSSDSSDSSSEEDTSSTIVTVASQCALTPNAQGCRRRVRPSMPLYIPSQQNQFVTQSQGIPAGSFQNGQVQGSQGFQQGVQSQGFASQSSGSFQNGQGQGTQGFQKGVQSQGFGSQSSGSFQNGQVLSSQGFQQGVQSEGFASQSSGIFQNGQAGLA